MPFMKDTGERHAMPIWKIGNIECADVVVWKCFVSNAGNNIMILVHPNMSDHIMLAQNDISTVARLYPDVIKRNTDGSFTTENNAVLKNFSRKARIIQPC